jgi:hypothetical protein
MIMAMKNSNDTIENRTRGLPASSDVVISGAKKNNFDGINPILL